MKHATSQINKDIFNRYMKSLLSGDKASCGQVIQDLLKKKTDIKDIYINLLQQSMYKIGSLWEKNKISIATEHLATAITESLLGLIYPTLFSTNRTGKKAVICCVPNEYHQIGARMVADMFELYGWDSYFLGGNTPLGSLLDFVNKTKPHLIGISLSLRENSQYLEKIVQKIRLRFKRIDIIVGGQAFLYGAQDLLKKLPEVHYIAEIQNLETAVLDKK
jgi:methanogenic corrinoid protein MtbC1